jgi:uncharacterized protein with NRDE domain
MCVVFFIKNSLNYKLIIAGNRDEFLSRPSIRAHFWSEFPGILGGIDALESNLGTWMGINRNGDFSFLTNKRTDPVCIIKGKKSRGLLVSNFLKTGNSKTFLQNLNSKDYNGYFLVVGNVNESMYISSHDYTQELQDNVVYGLSNGDFYDSMWPKVENGKKRFAEIITKDKSILVKDLFDLLKDRTLPSQEEMPEPIFNKEIEDQLASICVECTMGDQEYATRTHTVILVDYQDNVYFEEIDRYQKVGEFGSHSVHFEFQLVNTDL